MINYSAVPHSLKSVLSLIRHCQGIKQQPKLSKSVQSSVAFLAQLLMSLCHIISEEVIPKFHFVQQFKRFVIAEGPIVEVLVLRFSWQILHHFLLIPAAR